VVKKAAQAIPNQLLRRARLERGWTQKVVAERIGAPNDMMITRWERGTAFPSAAYVERLCQLFEQRASDLGLLKEAHPMVSSSPVAGREPRPGSGEERAREPVPSTLPVPLTSFFGREHEMAVVVALLRNPSVRLVTLTGPGGVGKTRLALSLAAAVADSFAEGVCFVPLAEVRNPEQVLPAIARALGLWEGPDHALWDDVRDFLREKHLLLLLDNFEQVAAVSSQVATLALCYLSHTQRCTRRL
jgi:transcriptional regulator with XRE-family HTH domain